MTGRERFLNTIEGITTDRTPVFPLLMHISAKHFGISYKEFASNGKALAEAQIFMSEHFAIDAITACSDAMRISADLGGEVIFPTDGPPYMESPIVKTSQEIDCLVRPDPLKGRMADRILAVNEMKRNIGDKLAVVGWIEMPYAEASNLVGVADFMMMAISEPETAHKLMSFLTDIEIDFALAQIEAGADMIGAGDAAASLISPDMYVEFALPYEQKVIDAIHKAGSLAKLHVCGNTEKHMQYMLKANADLYNVDHMVDFDKAKQIYSTAEKCFKGNLDPVADILQETPEGCLNKSINLIRKSENSKYILSAGCEIPKNVSGEILTAFCNAPQLV